MFSSNQNKVSINQFKKSIQEISDKHTNPSFKFLVCPYSDGSLRLKLISESTDVEIKETKKTDLPLYIKDEQILSIPINEEEKLPLTQAAFKFLKVVIKDKKDIQDIARDVCNFFNLNVKNEDVTKPGIVEILEAVTKCRPLAMELGVTAFDITKAQDKVSMLNAFDKYLKTQIEQMVLLYA